MEILLTTTGSLTTIIIPEWGNRTFTHPTVNYNLLDEFDIEEIRGSLTLRDLLEDNHIVMVDEFGRSINKDNIIFLSDNQGLPDVLTIEGFENLSNIALSSIDKDDNFLLVFDEDSEDNFKIKLAELPISDDVTTALNNKQDELISGTNIRTVNNQSLLGSGNITINEGVDNHSELNLDDGTNPHGTTAADVGLWNVDNTSDLDKPISTAVQDALDDKQDELISGTNIRTINNQSLLGSGNLSIAGISTLNGLTDTSQNFASNNDANVQISISSVTDTHTFSLSWNGLLAIDRGGTNNNTFEANEIIIYDDVNDSLQSSGFVFNDAGDTASDIWSADRIIDYVNNLSFIFNSNIVAGTLTTTATADTLMTGMQFTDILAGTYLLNFGTSLSHGSNSASIFISVYVNGTQVSGSEREWRRGGGPGDIAATTDLAGFPIILTTTSTVEIRWRTSTGTATSTNRHINLLRVDRLSV